MALSRILVPLDGSSIAESAYRHALVVARTTGARLHLLRVLDSHRTMDQSTDTLEWRLHQVEATRYLEHQAAIGREAIDDQAPIEVHVAEGKPAERIAQFIKTRQIDLLVLSAYGAGGSSDFPFGGTAHKVLTTQHVSYLVVRQAEASRGLPDYGRLLVPLDGSRKAELAISFARMLDRDHSMDIALLHVFGLPSMTRKGPLTEQEQRLCRQLIECNETSARAYMDDVGARLAPHHRIHIRFEAASNPARRIAEVAQQDQADLMILTAYGGAELNGWSRESICQSLLADTNIPVLILQDGLQLASNGSDARDQNESHPLLNALRKPLLGR